MIGFLLQLLLSAGVLLLVANFVSGFEIKGFRHALLGALVLGLVNALVRPLIVLLTLPITVLTLGLFLLVINALMLMLASAMVPGVRVRSFGAAFLASLVISLLNVIIVAIFAF